MREGTFWDAWRKIHGGVDRIVRAQSGLGFELGANGKLVVYLHNYRTLAYSLIIA